MAQTLYAQGDPAEARKLKEQVLEASIRLLGKEHPDTLRAMHNLAGTLYGQGELAGARKLQEQGLEASIRLLGKEHPDTVRSMLNLAQMLYAQGELAEARQTRLEAMARLVRSTRNTLSSMLTRKTISVAGIQTWSKRALSLWQRQKNTKSVAVPDLLLRAW